MFTEPTKSDLFFSKKDPEDPRLGDLFLPASKIQKNSFLLLGYPDDEGVKLNGGRVGAAAGPDEMRKHLFKMTPSLHFSKTKKLFYDLGNLKTDVSLANRHENAKELVLESLSAKSKVITCGGGHDYGYSDMAAFCLWCAKYKKKPFIINFDAHLDVRPNHQSPHSGTPFYRLLSEFNHIEFIEVGIQDWCNSNTHLEWAQKKKAKIIFLNEILQGNLEKLLFNKYLKGFNPKKHELALSIDLDGFSSAFCPGASQVFPVGLNANDFLKVFQKLMAKFSPPLVGFYELNPTYDLDYRTAKLAALLAHQFLFLSKN